jgi:hypothetical protein
MSDFDAKDFVELVNDSKTPEEVDAVFEVIKSLPSAQQKQALDEVEKAFVAYWRENLPPRDEIQEVKAMMAEIDRTKDTPQGQFMKAQLDRGPDDESLIKNLSMSQIFLNLHNLKGEAADPVVKIYVEAASKLSDDDYGTFFGQLKLLVNVWDKLSEAEAANAPAVVKKNPFRKGPNPS